MSGIGTGCRKALRVEPCRSLPDERSPQRLLEGQLEDTIPKRYLGQSLGVCPGMHMRSRKKGDIMSGQFFIDCHCHLFNLVDVPLYETIAGEVRVTTLRKLVQGFVLDSKRCCSDPNGKQPRRWK